MRGCLVTTPGRVDRVESVLLLDSVSDEVSSGRVFEEGFNFVRHEARGFGERQIFFLFLYDSRSFFAFFRNDSGSQEFSDEG
jgi:hypothetical protein